MKKLNSRKLHKEILRLKIELEIVNHEIETLQEKKEQIKEHLWNLERLENEKE